MHKHKEWYYRVHSYIVDYSKGFAIDVLASDFFKEVETHNHEEVLCVFMQETFVVGYVFVIGFSDPFPESDSFGIIICLVNGLLFLSAKIFNY